MQVVLQENFPSLGFIGDVVRVKSGFARNFLIPNKIAIIATQGGVKQFEHRKRQIEVKKAEGKKAAQSLKDKLEGVHIKLDHAASSQGKLFGSVTVGDIHDSLVKLGFTVDRRLIKLEAPIRATGDHDIDVKLHQDVIAKVRVTVTAIEEPKPAKDAAPAVATDGKTKRPAKAPRAKAAKKTDDASDGSEDA